MILTPMNMYTNNFRQYLYSYILNNVCFYNKYLGTKVASNIPETATRLRWTADAELQRSVLQTVQVGFFPSTGVLHVKSPVLGAWAHLLTITSLSVAVSETKS